MELEHLSPSSELTTALAAELAAIRNSAKGSVPTPEVTGPQLSEILATPLELSLGVWLARAKGKIVGWTQASVPAEGDSHVALLRGAVRPDNQRQGLGRALIEAALGASDRPLVRARAFDGTGGDVALSRLGFTRGRTSILGELRLASRDWATLSTPPDGYRFIRWVGPTPPESLDTLSRLREALHDAPDIDGYAKYTHEQIAQLDARATAHGMTQYTVVALRVITGEPAAFTVVSVNDSSPEIGVQLDTAVLPEHRGHRLGTALKADMAGWLRKQRQDVRVTHTWNDADNAPVLAVNRTLGVRPLAKNSVWELKR